jgi:alkanesulfonate monooxygenase SsuD/methylene tetrahydromethanopterin reductase-like flavin-dependent oxidoreductase (luciferase family)
MSATHDDLLVGIGISTGTDDDPLAEAIAAEAAGYDFVSASDHPVGATPSYETPTLLTWIAARTSRIRVATRVLGIPFRRPLMVAKAAETLQRLSAGRLILGLGGGYSDEEIVAVGGRLLSPREKVDGMSEAIEAIRGGWSGAPTPTPSAPIPIWLGTYGPRALAVTGRLADGWIPSLGFAPPRQVPEMLDRIRASAVAAGREPAAVRAIYNVPVAIEASAEDGVVSGSAVDIVEQLQAFAELGFTGFNLIPTPGSAEVVAAEVLPALRQAGPQPGPRHRLS